MRGRELGGTWSGAHQDQSSVDMCWLRYGLLGIAKNKPVSSSPVSCVLTYIFQEERAELEAVSERGSLERLNSEQIEQELKPIVAQVSLLEKELGQMEKTVKGNKILLNKVEKLRRGSIEWK